MQTIFPLLLAMLVSGGIYIGSMLFCLFRRTYLKAFLLGTGTFIISQVFLRIPLLQLANQISPDYRLFLASHPILNGLFLSLTAGIFEEFGRFLAFHLLRKKQLVPKQAIFFGLGHGGVEALLLGFIPVVTNYTQVVLDTSTLYLMSIERFLAIALHILLSTIVCYGVARKRKRFCILAILLHTGANFIITIVSLLSSNPAVFEWVFAFYILASYLFWVIYLKKHQKISGGIQNEF